MSRWLWRPAAALGARGLVLACVVLGVAAPAAAQTTTVNSLSPLSSPSGSITLIPNAQGIDRVRDYYSPARPWWISYDDCIADDAFTFTLSVRDTSDPLEVWAGTENCATNRSRADRGQCWIVARESQLSDTVDVRVPVRNILLRNLNVTDPPTSVGPEVCDDSTDPSGEAITFYFMLVDGGQADEYFAWDGGAGGTGFDVVGPEPPGTIEVGIGESQLAISIRGVEEETDRERFEAFCVPAGTTRASLDGDAGVPLFIPAAGLDAGLDPAATSDAGGVAPAACFTDVLRAGERPPPEFSCGTAGETARTLRTSRLQNEVQYAVAVAAQDNLGNAGVASAIQCGRPTQLDDFFELYSRAGGLGGGGFCSFSPGRTAGAPRGLAALLLLLVGLSLRRKKGAA